MLSCVCVCVCDYRGNKMGDHDARVEMLLKLCTWTRYSGGLRRSGCGAGALGWLDVREL
jgi:hypothetical protein